MATTPAQRRLADALTALEKLQDDGRTVLKSGYLTRLQRESLGAGNGIQTRDLRLGNLKVSLLPCFTNPHITISYQLVTTILIL